MLCDDIEGWDGVGGRLKREGVCKHLRLTYSVVWQKLIQHCKAINLQLKILKKKSESNSLLPHCGIFQMNK